MNKVIYCFWTGHNQMSANRKACFDSMFKSECDIILVTPKNLKEFIIPDYPLHPSFNYLNLAHKADYLRCYFMHHYGGGYSDVKAINSSWVKAFEDIQDDLYYINGYQETSPQGVANVDGDLYSQLVKNYKKLLGCCSFICKPNTPFTNDWMNQLSNKLDYYLPLLKQNPAIHSHEKPGMVINGSPSKYPIPWTDILGNIFHPLCLKYQNNIKQTVPLFENCSYR